MFKKLVAIGDYGFPDRTVFCGDGRIFYVELKTAKGSKRKLQDVWEKKLNKWGFECYTIHSLDEFKEVLERFLRNE